MQNKVHSLLDNGIWTLVDLLEGRRVVNNMWVWKVKTYHLRQVERFKARFVAKGCSQRQGVDYTKRLFPVIRMASLRVMLAINAAMDLGLCLMDIDNALYAPLKHDVFIIQPMGFSDGTSRASHLKRYLYGLKPSPTEFNELLRDWLISNG
jgi:hypothetical protein